jgi:hypothetical protein
MRRSSFIFGMLLAGSALVTSCNKDLKDDVKDLKGQVSEMENSLGSNEPITATTTFKDENNVTRTITDTYKFKAGNNYSQRMVKNTDGTYDVRIERFSDVEWFEGAWMSFNYNPTTKAITDKQGGHYWDDYGNYNDEVVYYDYDDEVTINITLDKFDTNTGDVSIKFSASATEEYTNEVPTSGKPVSTNFAFTGKLKIFEREDD